MHDCLRDGHLVLGATLCQESLFDKPVEGQVEKRQNLEQNFSSSCLVEGLKHQEVVSSHVLEISQQIDWVEAELPRFAQASFF